MPHLRTQVLTQWVQTLVHGHVIDLVLEMMHRRNVDRAATVEIFEFNGKSQGFSVQRHGSRQLQHRGYPARQRARRHAAARAQRRRALHAALHGSQ